MAYSKDLTGDINDQLEREGIITARWNGPPRNIVADLDRVAADMLRDPVGEPVYLIPPVRPTRAQRAILAALEYRPEEA